MIIAISGAIKSGKTTLSARLAERLGWPRASFGDCVRPVARERGLDESRESLQALGAELVAQNPEAFICRTLAAARLEPDPSVVLEGVRHLEIFEKLRRIAAPATVLLVYVDISISVRASRLGLDEKAAVSELRRLDEHSTEVQVAGTLLSVADLVVDGAKDVDKSVEEIVDWLEGRDQGHA